MNLLTEGKILVKLTMIDYALSLVQTKAGKERIEYFLFNGNQIQQNYACLYFKRRGMEHLLQQAVASGCVDEIQALSK